MRLIESVGESPFSPIAARDQAVKGVFSIAQDDGLDLDWHKATEMSGKFNESGHWVFRHRIKVPIIGQRGV